MRGADGRSLSLWHSAFWRSPGVALASTALTGCGLGGASSVRLGAEPSKAEYMKAVGWLCDRSLEQAEPSVAMSLQADRLGDYEMAAEALEGAGEAMRDYVEAVKALPRPRRGGEALEEFFEHWRFRLDLHEQIVARRAGGKSMGFLSVSRPLGGPSILGPTALNLLEVSLGSVA